MSVSSRATAIFDAEDGKLQEVAKSIDERLEKLEERFKELKETAIGLFVLEKLPELYEKLSEGIKQVLEVGAHFHDLAANTGDAVSELVVMEDEFKSAGKAAEDIQPILGNMFKTLEDGSANAMITNLGVELEELKTKTPIEQFHELGKSIAALQNPMDRAFAARALFGKEGGTLMSLFSEADAFEEAEVRVGEQAKILGEDAALFSAASTKIQSAGVKAQGFFVGIADRVVPVLMPLLDRFEKFDASRAGQGLGNMINAFATNSTPGQTIVTSLMLSGAQFVNFLVDGLSSAAMSFGMLMKGVALAFASEIERSLAETMIGLSGKPGMGFLAAPGGALLATSQMDQADMKNSADRMATWTHVGLMDGIIRTLSENLTGQIDDALSNASGIRADELKKHPELNQQMGAPELMQLAPNVSHLASIGGAYGTLGGSDPLLEANSIAREHTQLLRDIKENTGQGMSSTPRKPVQHPE